MFDRLASPEIIGPTTLAADRSDNPQANTIGDTREVQILTWSTEIVSLTCGKPLATSLLKCPRQDCCETPSETEIGKTFGSKQSKFFDPTWPHGRKVPRQLAGAAATIPIARMSGNCALISRATPEIM